jgi:hypothetical protein
MIILIVKDCCFYYCNIYKNECGFSFVLMASCCDDDSVVIECAEFYRVFYSSGSTSNVLYDIKITCRRNIFVA